VGGPRSGGHLYRCSQELQVLAGSIAVVAWSNRSLVSKL
jgi:hypothetical protein